MCLCYRGVASTTIEVGQAIHAVLTLIVTPVMHAGAMLRSMSSCLFFNYKTSIVCELYLIAIIRTPAVCLLAAVV